MERKDEEPVAPEMTPDPEADVTTEGVRRQRRHIEELDGEDPLRGGVAD
ncbi:hypothetical protein [Caulobacter sp.]|jgi:hypothetical protein